VARTDVARLAAAVLVDVAHAGAVYDVSGAQAIDLHETARLLADVSGRDIRYHAETMDEARASRTCADDWEIEGWVGSYAGIATGEIGVTSHTVEHVTGRRPWSCPDEPVDIALTREDVITLGAGLRAYLRSWQQHSDESVRPPGFDAPPDIEPSE